MIESKSPFRGQGYYDFIFLGAGCATLSIVMRMIKSGKFADKKILLIDKEPKSKNDRTWCFWEKENGFFENIVYKKWGKLSFLSEEYSNTMDISPYQYKMIRGGDFYNYCFSEITKYPNIEIFYGKVNSISFKKDQATIELDDREYVFDGAIIFNSIFYEGINRTSGSTIDLLQHFKGWMIETPSAAFDPTIATFMDFRIDQKRGTTFAYVLPLSETKALVEYTLFTKSILKEEEYKSELKNYLTNFLKLDKYKITEEEFGVILMTTRKFDFYRGDAYNIGSAGGQTKASSGYTFQFIQKQAEAIIWSLIEKGDLLEAITTSSRFHFYDKVLLDVLDNKRVSGKQVFTTLFKKNKSQQVLKFLDNESSSSEELQIISTLPILPFLRAAFNQL